MSRLLQFVLETQPDFRKARLPSLYSDFHVQRQTNPEGYATNVAAWEKALAAAAKAQLLPDGILAIQVNSKLEHELQTREYGLPQSLDLVIEEGVVHGRIAPLSVFLSSAKSIYSRSWDITLWTLPVKVLNWAVKQGSLSSRFPKDPAQKYVLINNVEDAGNSVASMLMTKTRRVDRAVPMAQFREEAIKCLRLRSLTETDLQIMLRFLARDKNLIAYDDTVIKVKASTEDEPSLTREDLNICSIKSLISDLDKQVEMITKRVEELNMKAKTALGQSNRTSALSALRSKKVQEGLLVKRSETLTQLEGVFNRIEEASNQVEVVKAMERSTQVLHSLNKELGGVERVEDALENLHEEMGELDEIGITISEQEEIASGIDAIAIEAELEQMEAEAKATHAQEEEAATREHLMELDDNKIPDQVTGQVAEATIKMQPEALLGS